MRTLDQIYWDSMCHSTCECIDLNSAMEAHPALKDMREAYVKFSPPQKDYVVKPSPIDGQGVFALFPIAKRRKIGELTGQEMSVHKIRKLIAGQERIHAYEYPGHGALLITNELKYINHSCKPNAFLRNFKRRLEIYALRTIEPGEEITLNYGPTTHHAGTVPCNCGCQSHYL